MNIRRTLTALAAFAVLTVSQSVMANGVSFYQKASEAQASITGKVAMRLTIGTDGDISNMRVVRSSGSLDTDNSAIQWLEAQKMTSVFASGQAQEFSLVKEIKFSETGKINRANLR